MAKTHELDRILQGRVVPGLRSLRLRRRGAEGVTMVDFPHVGRRPSWQGELPRTVKDAVLVAACPGIAIDAPAASRRRPTDPDELVVGPTEAIWEGWASDADMRRVASSGGAVSALAMYAVEQLGMALIVHIGMDPTQPWLNRTTTSTDRSGLAANVGSRYASVVTRRGAPAHRGERPPLRLHRQAMRRGSRRQAAPGPSRPRPQSGPRPQLLLRRHPDNRRHPSAGGFPRVRAAPGHHLADVPGRRLAGAVPGPGQGRARGVAHVRRVLERTRPPSASAALPAVSRWAWRTRRRHRWGRLAPEERRDDGISVILARHRARTPDRRGSHPGRLSDGDAERCPQGRRGPRPRPPATPRGGQDRRTAPVRASGAAFPRLPPGGRRRGGGADRDREGVRRHGQAGVDAGLPEARTRTRRCQGTSTVAVWLCGTRSAGWLNVLSR